jgi:cytochrome c oxidase cbb3-type subunit 4
MDYINDFRSVMTVVAFLTFLGIVWYAYSRHFRAGFDEAAQLPFIEEDDVVRPSTPRSHRGPQ